MTAAQPQKQTSVVSIGDDGVLNHEITSELAELWIDRDLSWLEFNERVLAEALDKRTPLLERAKFLAIFTSNLDEFFMKRIAVLRPSLTPHREKLLHELNVRLIPTLEKQAACFREEIIPGLASHGVFLRHWEELTEAQKNEANTFFDKQVSPALTPLLINTGESFPFLSNLSTSLVFPLDDDASGGQRSYARVKVPADLKHWVSLKEDLGPDNLLYVRLHEIIRENLTKLYAGMKVGPTTIVRLTQDAEVEEEDNGSGNVLDQVREQVRKRRYEPVVRLEFGGNPDPAIRDLLRSHFQLLPADVYEASGELDYTTLFELGVIDKSGIRDTPWNPVVPPALRQDHADIFSAIREGDVFVHHPYESFEGSVERFIKEAANDPQTVAVKMTVYRVGDDTPFVKSLIHAAEAGKQVACVIELKARFDEERNVHWAKELRAAGAHVTFGVKGLKTHGKSALVVRKEADGLKAYAHVGTGNYHVKTARLYADCGLLTCDPAITTDVVLLFHFLTGHAHGPYCHSLLVAPSSMRTRFLAMVKRETDLRERGRIIAKMNQLEDPELIEALIEAARAGVSIDLIVRGFCCLKPIENIRIRSIIGRFLEHSRIYYFGAGQPLGEGEFFIGSADWMFRNLSKRIEVATPVKASGAKQRLWEILEICLKDKRQAWMLGNDGRYARDEAADDPGVHRLLMDLASR
jgi:polyphosphate kinase